MGPPLDPFQPYADRHATPDGPGDSRPTALEVVKDNDMLGKLTGKTVLITGASAGLGAATAKALHETGARLFLTGRDMSALKETIKDIIGNSTSRHREYPSPEAVEMHLDTLAGVRAAANAVRSRTKTLNILINNAGTAGTPLLKSRDGLELNMATNYYAHFLFFMELKALLLAGAKMSGTTSRVINLSSSAHWRSGIHFEDINFNHREYTKSMGYGQSKTANIYMANSVTRRYGTQGITGLSVHPGVISTSLTRHMSPEETSALMARIPTQAIKSVEQGAATTVWAAVSPHFENVNNGGRYLADVGECGPVADNPMPAGAGYATHAYHEKDEERLWKASCEAVGVADDWDAHTGRSVSFNL